MAEETTTQETKTDELRVPRRVLIALWSLVAPLVVLAVVAVVGLIQAGQRHDSVVATQQELAATQETLLRRLEQSLSSEMADLARSMDELSVVIAQTGEDSVSAQRDSATALGQINFTVASMQQVIQDLEAWECVHAWNEVFALERFNFDDIRGSATGQEVLDLLSDLHFSCSFEFGPFG